MIFALWSACADPSGREASPPTGDLFLVGSVTGLPPGEPFRVKGCGGEAETSRLGTWVLRLAEWGGPCLLEVEWAGTQRASYSVEHPEEPHVLPIGLAAFGVWTAPEGPLVVLASLRTDDALEVGDELLALDGHPLAAASLDRETFHLSGGYEHQVRVLRRGQRLELPVVLLTKWEYPGFHLLDQHDGTGNREQVFPATGRTLR